MFGLSGTVRKEEFLHLLNGFSPDGRQGFFKNSGDPERNAFWDLVFSVPKDVSVVWMRGSDEVRERIDQAIDKALYATLEYAQENYGLSRRGAGGKDWVPAALTMAIFRHISSRANQPQLHRHALLFNLGIREDGTVGTLQTKPLFEAKMELGLYFRHELAADLTQDLGMEIQHEKSGFHIVGVPKEVSRHFSKRRHQIVEYMNVKGLVGGKEAKIAAVNTRAAKSYIPQAVLLSSWQKEADSMGFTEAHVEKLIGRNFRQEHANDMASTVPHEPEASPSFGQRESNQHQNHDDLRQPRNTAAPHESSAPLPEVKPPPQRNEKENQAHFGQGDGGDHAKVKAHDSPRHIHGPTQDASAANQRDHRQDKSMLKPPPGGEEKENKQKEGSEHRDFREKSRPQDSARDFHSGHESATSANQQEHQHKKSKVNPPPGAGGKEKGKGTERDHRHGWEKTKTRASTGGFHGQHHDSKHEGAHRHTRSQQRGPTGTHSQSDPKALKAFKDELRKATDRIFPENQTRQRVEKMAFAMGAKYNIRARDILKAVDGLRLPIHRKLYRVEWRPIFKNAPKWSPVAGIRSPRIVLFNKPRKWGKIVHSTPIPAIGGPTMEFRKQERKLFPKAPAWSPVSKLSVKAYRFGPYRPHAYAQTKKAGQTVEKEKKLHP